MSDLHIIMASDVFPPRCGGAGWSTHALAVALQGQGYTVTAIVPQERVGRVERNITLGVPTVRVPYTATRLPFVRNYHRHERLWRPLADAIVAEIQTATRPVVIHAQHVQSVPAAIFASERTGAPVVATVRDHWPWDYFATGLHGGKVPFAGTGWVATTTDLIGRQGPLRGVASLVAVPYIHAHLRRRQAFLRRADAVVAVSRYIAQRLAPIVAAERIHTLPNLLNLDAIDRVTATAPVSVQPQEPFLLMVGKLEHNKGAHLLVPMLRDIAAGAGTLPELVIAGDGPLKPLLEREFAALGVRARFLDWVDHDEVLRLMARCTLLLFPSVWGEPLSRVPLEAQACGAVVVAMPTGGTPDIIEDGVNGVLTPTPEQMARQVMRLLGTPAERHALSQAARARAEAHFSASKVVPQMMALYQDVLTQRTPVLTHDTH